MLKQLKQMYLITWQNHQLGWSFEDIIRSICVNDMSGSLNMVETLNELHFPS